MKKFFSITVAQLFMGTLAFSQGQIALYQMQKSLPQANYVNPAFAPKSKIIIGLPIVSSTYISMEAPFSVNDVLKPSTSSDSLRIDTDALVEALSSDSRVDIDGSSSLLFLGLNNKNSFMNLSFNSRINGSFSYPGSLFELIIDGPATGDNGSKVIELEELDLRLSAFNEVAFGYNRQITDALRIGGKVKYLQGIANINVEGLNGTITTNIDSIHIESDPWSFQMAGFDYLADNPETGYFLFKNKNIGWALDFGAMYEVNDNIKVSASLLDIGSITWREHTKSYEFGEVDYTFEGFDFLEIVKDDGIDDETILEQEFEKLEDLFTPEQDSTDYSYKTPLTGRFYLGGTYTLMDMHTFGLVFYGDMFKSQLTPAMALTYNLGIGNILDVGVSASYRNNSFGNFGAGISVKAGPVQAYILGDNFESIFYPSRARVVGVRGGLVLAFGKASKTNF